MDLGPATRFASTSTGACVFDWDRRSTSESGMAAGPCRAASNTLTLYSEINDDGRGSEERDRGLRRKISIDPGNSTCDAWKTARGDRLALARRASFPALYRPGYSLAAGRRGGSRQCGHAGETALAAAAAAAVASAAAQRLSRCPLANL